MLYPENTIRYRARSHGADSGVEDKRFLSNAPRSKSIENGGAKGHTREAVVRIKYEEAGAA